MPVFRAPGRFERLFNRAFGWLIKKGYGLEHSYRLDVRGRRTGRVMSAPVNLLVRRRARYLVAPRGRTHRVRNAEQLGMVTLVKGVHRERVKVLAVDGPEKLDILKACLDSYARTVQRFFPDVEAGSVH
ncbi:MAG: hypothetical protein HY749_00130 [Gammaproteobacteria bacterium]|nr:hypothetical protein [Gammaproteobacteria bacterium]